MQRFASIVSFLAVVLMPAIGMAHPGHVEHDLLNGPIFLGEMLAFAAVALMLMRPRRKSRSP